jgi:hypothetical protein
MFVSATRNEPTLPHLLPFAGGTKALTEADPPALAHTSYARESTGIDTEPLSDAGDRVSAGPDDPSGRSPTTTGPTSASYAITACPSERRAEIRGGAGGSGARAGGAIPRRGGTKAAGLSQCGRRPGLRGLAESIGDALAFVSPHQPGQWTQGGWKSPSTSSVGEIAGPRPSAWSNHTPVQWEPVRK